MKAWRILLNSLLLTILLALLIPAILGVRGRMDTIRTENELTATTVVENAPPIVAFTTVALGSFRGLVADFLWLRSAKMQEEGNYFEMVQLASWIVKLQPRFTGATAYLAWNMAYNISVTFNSFEDRWRWVQRGIELIRDEALVYNPGDPELFKELGWIYQHKLGQEMDDANRYYKLQLARSMMAVVGKWPADWEQLANAPSTAAGLRAALTRPEALDEILARQQITLKELAQAFRQNQGFPDNIRAELTDPLGRQILEQYLRRDWLESVYKLEPQRILEMNRKYGQLDWRLPEAHAIYWATRGLEVAEQGVNIACERMVFQSLSNAFRGGRLIYLEDAETLEITPNISLVEAVNREYLQTLEQHRDNIGIRAGYENFLIDAVVTLYIFGQTTTAREYYSKLREKYPNKENRLPLDEFAMRELAGDVASATYDQGQAAVQGYLYQMFYALAIGDLDRAEALERIAEQIWRKYMRSVGAGAEKRRGLAPYRQMQQTMYERCMQAFPPALRARLSQIAGTRFAETPNAPEGK